MRRVFLIFLSLYMAATPVRYSMASWESRNQGRKDINGRKGLCKLDENLEKNLGVNRQESAGCPHVCPYLWVDELIYRWYTPRNGGNECQLGRYYLRTSKSTGLSWIVLIWSLVSCQAVLIVKGTRHLTCSLEGSPRAKNTAILGWPPTVFRNLNWWVFKY